MKQNVRLQVSGVLDVEEGIPKLETTISQNGNLRGTDITIIVTYCSIPRPSEEGRKELRVFYAEGKGVLMTKGGSETATWTGQGIAHVFLRGQIAGRYSVAHHQKVNYLFSTTL